MAFLLVNATSQASTSRDQGVDWSEYNSNSGAFGYSTDYKSITQGTVLKVFKDKKRNLTTQYVLSDGSYITDN